MTRKRYHAPTTRINNKQIRKSIVSVTNKNVPELTIQQSNGAIPKRMKTAVYKSEKWTLTTNKILFRDIIVYLQKRGIAA